MLVDRMKLMLRTGDYADVHFLVGDGDGKEIIPAHRAVLNCGSDVFAAMFRYEANKAAANASSNCLLVVEIPDVEPAAFKVMLSTIYAGDLADLNGHNAMAVLYAAKKYNIPELVDPCLQVPVSSLRNVFMAYAQADLFDLEDFANYCLAYIDKNADTLIKSEAFLQIDQQLLCEILGRDQLKIRDETSIWNAVIFVFKHINFINFNWFFSALRWADEKCRENCVECSAENRRQMLGPALFKIRFPLFSEENFSEKIVTSGILTAEEVVNLQQQYRRNSTGALLYPLQFPTHGRRTFAESKMEIFLEIEKMSEFVREKAGCSRYSDKVYIDGLPWKIMAQISKPWGGFDEWFDIYLVCTAASKIDGGNWRCKCSATFRFLLPKNGTTLPIGTFCDHVFDRKFTKNGFEHVIPIENMMHPSEEIYNQKEDKVTLAIVVTTSADDEDDEPRMDDTFNLDDQTTKPKGTLFMDIEKVSDFLLETDYSERKSETVHIKGFGATCKIWAHKRPANRTKANYEMEHGFTICLLFDAPKKGKKWRCNCSATLRIVSQKSGVEDYKNEMSIERTFINKSNQSHCFEWISFLELMDPSKGLYNESEDKVTLAIDIS
ncbi:hypothetical protein niasHT_017354 [Heterodera trifolii]|uniref:BTB domain-containing protein n=1 Tax=Heterodera trifolii TaxID=157864 RepID=A0ABD2L488_9BILA